ncbi:MAG: hypothetical protein HY785_23705 [Oscillatoriophycideae cyanobacterium NC_groundwater_1537_Pr4_S-0.65um_50_18]|nr:hypothetical protein [Oscillatoriophycideae cyanobacterium NC_groundwater_1537_Pr4_S-0.65um_50_18]
MKQIVKRVITCQGTIQLVTALSVMAHREQEQMNQGLTYENYLVVYDLFGPSDQSEEFYHFIETMAKLIYSWEKIVYISPKEWSDINRMRQLIAPRRVYQRICDLVGTDSTDEIYLSTNWHPRNQLLTSAYINAYKICYGDGLGIYYAAKTKDFSTKSSDLIVSLSENLRTKSKDLFNWIRIHLNLGTPLQMTDFDYGYLLLPNVIGKCPLVKFTIPDKSFFIRVLTQLTVLVNQDYIDSLREAIADAPIAILLGSNFSESGRMTQDDEVKAYREFLINEGIKLNSVLLIKPHPRDDRHKFEKLKFALSDICREIIVLDKPELFYLPFEVFLMKFFSFQNLIKLDAQVFTVSSACISLKTLFNVESAVGFGSAVTSLHFYKDFVGGRIQLENDLISALRTID